MAGGPEAAGPILSVRHLTVATDGRPALTDVSFDVEAGTTFAIVGPNGAGKTTLLRTLLGRLPYAGTVRWRGRVRIGYVPQKVVDTDLPMTVAEFLALKCPADYAACLATVGLPPTILAKPLGVLSGGEVQRVLIAWAVVDRPQVLFFDEPTSNVDLGSEDVILQALRHAQRRDGITVLLVTHDLHEIHHYADRVLALAGRVVFLGRPAELLADRALTARVFGLGPEEEIPAGAPRGRP